MRTIRDSVIGVEDGRAYLGKLANLGVKGATTDFDFLRGKLEKILSQGIPGSTAKNATRGIGFGDSQP
jgi:hypothetical protein